MLGHIHIAIGLPRAAATHKEGGDAHQLVLVDRRSSSVAGTQAGGILFGGWAQAEQILLLQEQLLLAVGRAQALTGGHLQAMAQGSIRLGRTPAREGNLDAGRRSGGCQINGLGVVIQDYWRLQLQQGQVIGASRRGAGVVLVDDHLGEGNQLAACQALNAAHSDGVRGRRIASWIWEKNIMRRMGR